MAALFWHSCLYWGTCNPHVIGGCICLLFCVCPYLFCPESGSLCTDLGNSFGHALHSSSPQRRRKRWQHGFPDPLSDEQHTQPSRLHGHHDHLHLLKCMPMLMTASWLALDQARSWHRCWETSDYKFWCRMRRWPPLALSALEAKLPSRWQHDWRLRLKDTLQHRFDFRAGRIRRHVPPCVATACAGHPRVQGATWAADPSECLMGLTQQSS